MDFVLKGHIVYNESPLKLHTSYGYLVCVDGVSRGFFDALPNEFSKLPVMDYGDRLILPGLVDLHVHAPQYSFQGIGFDLELLDWLETHTFPEEAKFDDSRYADVAYDFFVKDLVEGGTTRACIYATIHKESTLALMDKLEASGLVTMVGKVNMDRNSPDNLCEASAAESLLKTREWLETALEKYQHTYPIITPRFAPSCTDELMQGLGLLVQEYREKAVRKLAVQSHLSENPSEIEWVKALCPGTECYGDAYDRFGLFGKSVDGEPVPTVMAHCVYSADKEEDLLLANDVTIAHCPGSNLNLSSGIAPIRRFLKRGIKVALGSDVAGGTSTSMFRVMSDAIQVSKMYWRLINQEDAHLSVPEALYLATIGGGSFFGKVGSLAEGYEFDCIVVDDLAWRTPKPMNVIERLERIIYRADAAQVKAKFVRGVQVK